MRWAWLVLLAACTPGGTSTVPPPRPGVSPPSGTARVQPGTGTDALPVHPSQGHDRAAPAKPPPPTAMADTLKELGLDPAALPPLDKLEASTLRQVMKTFTRSLGVPCAACHDVKDFRAATPKKTIARHMWNDFARGLATKDGPLYCDSCHEGKPTFLDRSDPTSLAAWMQEAYVAPLVRTDAKEHGCPTCHGEPFVGGIFGTRWKR